MLKRNRTTYFLLVVSVILTGLLSRKFSDNLPEFLGKYSGDTLWGLMVFFIVGLIFANYTTAFIATIAFIFSCLIEISQLYQSEWINNLRHIKYVGLIFGYEFLWSDLICYAGGIVVGVLFEKFFIKEVSN